MHDPPIPQGKGDERLRGEFTSFGGNYRYWVAALRGVVSAAFFDFYFSCFIGMGCGADAQRALYCLTFRAPSGNPGRNFRTRTRLLWPRPAFWRPSRDQLPMGI